MMEIRIEDCGFGTRIVNSLKRIGVVTLSEFSDMPLAKQKAIRNLGAESLSQLWEKCRQEGLPENTPVSKQPYSKVDSGEHAIDDATSLSSRIRNTMDCAHIHTFEQFSRMTLENQQRIHNLGKKSLKELHAHCMKLGLPAHSAGKEFNVDDFRSSGYILEDCRTELSALAYNALDRAGIVSLLQFSCMTERDQQRIRCLGTKTLTEIHNLCIKVGLSPYYEDDSDKVVQVNVFDLQSFKDKGYPLRLCPLLTREEYHALCGWLGFKSLKQFSMMTYRQQALNSNLSGYRLQHVREICHKVGLPGYLDEDFSK